MRDPFIGPREGNDEIGDKPSVKLDWFFYDDVFINPAVPSELERRRRRFANLLNYLLYREESTFHLNETKQLVLCISVN